MGFFRIFVQILLCTVVISLVGGQLFASDENENSDENLELYHPCDRECQSYENPLTCYYEFTIQDYLTMSRACHNCPTNITDCYEKDCITADGIQRHILVVNKMMPGPAIEVCKGDKIVVDVANQMMSESISIHWHGLHMRNSNRMDGVSYVTQCPILSGTTFRYIFEADRAGTYFWHSHSSVQRGDGVFGALIIREDPDIDPHGFLYDFDLYEHMFIIQDWVNTSMVSYFTGHYHGNIKSVPENYLINGVGRSQKGATEIPFEEFFVEKDIKYRFRIMNTLTMNCPAELRIDGHNFTVIAADGNNLDPIEVTSLISHSGERFDVILDANQAIDNYWIHVKGFTEDCDHLHQKAILRYEGALEGKNPVDMEKFPGTQLNSFGDNAIPIVDLKSFNNSLNSSATLQQFYIRFDHYPKENPLFSVEGTNILTPQLNHISNKLPSSPLLQKSHKNNFCNESILKQHGFKCEEEFCECTHVIQIKLSSMVEIILIDEGRYSKTDHPFHLHGYSFWVIGMGKIGGNITEELIQEMDKNGTLPRNLDNPPKKDTVEVPNGGYTIIRFLADHPGYFLFHCHLVFHSELGMSVVFKVGEDNEMKKLPKHFPTCGDYLPNKNLKIVTTLEK